MKLGEKVKRFFLKLGFRYLPWIVFGTLTALIFIDIKKESNLERVVGSSNTDSWNISPDAKRIAFSSNKLNVKRDADVYVSGMNGENIECVIDSPDDDRFQRWSPDNSSFLFGRKNELYLFDLRSRQEQKVSEGPVYYANFSPDGRIITFYQEGTLHFFDRETLQTHKFPNAKTDSFIPQIRWNNRTALFKHGERLALFSLDNPKLERIVSEQVLSFDWAGNNIAYLAKSNTSVLQILDCESRKTSQVRLNFPGYGLLGTDGFVAVFSEDNQVCVADCASGSVS
ncbi:MAG: DPP IV N-terminal domain-containing protein, partial [Candidatus Woesearchaeota archaeon]